MEDSMRAKVLPLLLGLLPAAAAQHLDTGMVLLHTSSTATPGELGRLEVVYLSTGRRVVLDDGSTDMAAFSPDGRKVAFVRWQCSDQSIYTVNIDGTGLRQRSAGTVLVEPW